MSSWHEFLTMGGYGVYVWPSYGIALVIMIANAVVPGRQQRALLKQLRHHVNNGDNPS